MCGATFTLADIPIGLVVNRWFCLDFDKPAYPAVAAYYHRLGERPAYRSHVRNGLPYPLTAPEPPRFAAVECAGR